MSTNRPQLHVLAAAHGDAEAAALEHGEVVAAASAAPSRSSAAPCRRCAIASRCDGRRSHHVLAVFGAGALTSPVFGLNTSPNRAEAPLTSLPATKWPISRIVDSVTPAGKRPGRRRIEEERTVKLGHHLARMRIAAVNDDPVRVFEILDRRSLAQEFGIRYDHDMTSALGRACWMMRSTSSPVPTRTVDFVILRGKLGSIVHILESNDVVLTEITAGLHFDHFERDAARIGQSVHRADRDEDRLVLVDQMSCLADRSLGGAAHHHPMLSAMEMALQR